MVNVTGPFGATVFISDDGDRRETAILLTGTAVEYGLGKRAVSATKGGFFITPELAAILQDEPVSGNAAPEESEVEDEEAEDLYDPADYTIPQVKDMVTEQNDLEFAEGVLAAEQNGEDRTTLTKWLDEFIANHPDTSGNRAVENNSNTSEEE